MTTRRKLAVQEGRAMVRVRHITTREFATVGVCPACWNIPQRREVLLRKLEKMDLQVVSKADQLDGVYYRDRSHAPGCPHKSISADPWERFRKTLKKTRR